VKKENDNHRNSREGGEEIHRYYCRNAWGNVKIEKMGGTSDSRGGGYRGLKGTNHDVGSSLYGGKKREPKTLIKGRFREKDLSARPGVSLPVILVLKGEFRTFAK